MKIKTLIADDEPLARRGLQTLLASEKDVDVVAACADGVEAIAKIEDLRPDLVFLDIRMPEVDGFAVVRALRLERLPLIIFVTAFDDYALEAFRVHALDYLLKPVKAGDVAKALQRVRGYLRHHPAELQQRIEQLLAEHPQKNYLERLIVRGAKVIDVIKVEEVLWLEAEGDYVGIHTAAKKYLHREKIGALADQLDPAIFCRIHRSAIIRLDLIKQLISQSNGDYEIVLTTGKRLSLSRTYREKLFARLNR